MDKDELHQRRKEAYQQAKAKRDADLHYQALKEKANADRRKQYRAFKDQQKKAKREAKEKRIAEKDAALMALVMKGSAFEQHIVIGHKIPIIKLQSCPSFKTIRNLLQTRRT